MIVWQYSKFQPRNDKLNSWLLCHIKHITINQICSMAYVSWNICFFVCSRSCPCLLCDPQAPDGLFWCTLARDSGGYTPGRGPVHSPLEWACTWGGERNTPATAPPEMWASGGRSGFWGPPGKLHTPWASVQCWWVESRYFCHKNSKKNLIWLILASKKYYWVIFWIIFKKISILYR